MHQPEGDFCVSFAGSFDFDDMKWQRRVGLRTSFGPSGAKYARYILLCMANSSEAVKWIHLAFIVRAWIDPTEYLLHTVWEL